MEQEVGDGYQASRRRPGIRVDSDLSSSPGILSAPLSVPPPVSFSHLLARTRTKPATRFDGEPLPAARAPRARGRPGPGWAVRCVCGLFVLGKAARRRLWPAEHRIAGRRARYKTSDRAAGLTKVSLLLPGTGWLPSSCRQRH